MDRASRFIWVLDCGKKDRKLFKKAIKTLDKIARQTSNLHIFTDGERRYGNLLFEICHELVNNGKPGRPKKTFKRGVHVRMKNKGSQVHKKGRKRPKYQSPWREHPETARTIAETVTGVLGGAQFPLCPFYHPRSSRCRLGHTREADVCAGNVPDSNGISGDFKRQKRSHQTEPVPLDQPATKRALQTA